VRATAENFDVERNWALLSALLKTSPIEYIFIDRSLHPALRSQAEAVREAPSFVRDAFDGIDGLTRPLIRHARGHDDHVHVRFQSAVAVQAALRAQNALGKKAFRRDRLVAMLKVRAQKQQKK
jgi:penicillin-insensitive murein endopeptidase